MLPGTSPIELYEKSILCRVGHPESPGDMNETNSGEMFIKLKEMFCKVCEAAIPEEKLAQAL
jgi:hypothetical protein